MPLLEIIYKYEKMFIRVTTNDGETWQWLAARDEFKTMQNPKNYGTHDIRKH